MGKTKELLMRELSKDKDTRKQKFAVFQNRIEKKKGYLKALESLLDESKAKANSDKCDSLERARLWVDIFELEEKLLAQSHLLAQHIRYMEELKKVENESDL